MPRFIKKEDLSDISSGKTKSVLESIIETSNQISILKAKSIEFSKPLLTRNGEPILYPNTINIIQGQAGSHKSRLAQIIASALLTQQPWFGNNLDMLRVYEEEIMLLYADTERNIQDQFPYAVQRILNLAGYEIKDDPDNFDYISLIPFIRNERFDFLRIFLELLRKRYDAHLVIILDVITDFINNFNDPEESLKLMDLLNHQVNLNNVTFLCIIHENPGSSKARGHAGSEINNKASCVIQVNFVEGSDSIVCIKNLKNRNARPFTPFYAQYSSETNTLGEVNGREVFSYAPVIKAPVDQVAEALGKFLEPGPLLKAVLYPKLRELFKCGDRILDDRLKQIIDDEYVIHIKIGECRLEKSSTGKERIYGLKLINYEN